MWRDWHIVGFFGWTMMIIFWMIVIALVIWAFRAAGTTAPGKGSDALSVLEHRYATGEIEREEFDERRQVLEAARKGRGGG
jgi:putative membrane protein